MIKYQLQCNEQHTFEAWFSNSTGFDNQSKAGEVVCPVCGSTDVEKALMAPAVKTRRNHDRKSQVGSESQSLVHNAADKDVQALSEAAAEAVDTLRKLRRHVEENAEYVGPRFAEEARKIHFEETEKRGIWGQATSSETRELLEEGISVLPVPELPEDNN